jgi:hypothetical protein
MPRCETTQPIGGLSSNWTENRVKPGAAVIFSYRSVSFLLQLPSARALEYNLHGGSTGVIPEGRLSGERRG